MSTTYNNGISRAITEYQKIKRADKAAIDSKIIELYKDGLTINDLHERFGKPKSYLYTLLKGYDRP